MSLDIIYIVAGIMLGIVATARIEFAMWLILALALVVGGLASYFVSELGRVQWAAAVLSFFLILRTIIAFVANPRDATGHSRVIFFVMLFAIATLITVVLNVDHLLDAAISAKNTFQFLSVLLALGLVIRNDRFTRQLMAAFIVIAALQPIIAILQYFMERGSLFVGDRISGTFGGVRGMPGDSASLTLFMLIQTAAVLALVQQKRLGWKAAIPLIVWFAIPMLLAHVKALILLLPLMFLVLYGSQWLKRPLVAIGGLLAITALAGATLYYQYRTADEYRFDRLRPTSISEFISSSFAYNFSQEQVRELNRLRAIQFWWQEHSHPKQAGSFFLGHGLGATRDSGISFGHLAVDPRYAGRGIGVTALPRLLWETGVVGTTLYAAVFVVAFFAARRLRSHPALPSPHQAYMTSSMAACLIFLFTFPYNASLFVSQAFSAFAMFMLGYVAFWERYCTAASSSRAGHPSPPPPQTVAPVTHVNTQTGVPIGIAVSRGSDVVR